MKSSKKAQQPRPKYKHNLGASDSTFNRFKAFAEPLVEDTNDAMRNTLYRAEAFPPNIPAHIIVAFLQYLSQRENIEEEITLQHEQINKNFIEHWDTWIPTIKPREESALSSVSPHHEQPQSLHHTETITEKSDNLPLPHLLEIPATPRTEPPGTKPKNENPDGADNPIKTPEYQRPTLLALRSLGGEAHVSDIIQHMEDHMKPRFSQADLKTNQEGKVIWKNRAQHAREMLQKYGMAQKTDKPMVWAITPSGTERLNTTTN